MLRKLQSAVALLTCGCMVGYAAVPVSIGILVTDRPALVNGIPIRGNSTLFSGNVIKAASAASSLWFADGSSLVLQPGARVRVFRDYSVLEQGVATQTGSNKRELIVDGLTVASLSGQGAVAAAWRDNSHFEATAENAPAEVRTPVGQLVARLNPGERLTFTTSVASAAQQKTPPSPAGPPITVRGILRQEPEGEFKITNDSDGQEYIVEGDFPLSALGASVQLRGNAEGVVSTVMCRTPSAQGGSAPCQIIIAHSTRVLAAGSSRQGGPNQEASKQQGPKQKKSKQNGSKQEGPDQQEPDQEGSGQEASKREAPKEEGPAPTPTAESSRWHSGTIIIIAAVAGGGALAAVLALGKSSGSPSTSAP